MQVAHIISAMLEYRPMLLCRSWVMSLGSATLICFAPDMLRFMHLAIEPWWIVCASAPYLAFVAAWRIALPLTFGWAVRVLMLGPSRSLGRRIASAMLLGCAWLLVYLAADPPRYPALYQFTTEVELNGVVLERYASPPHPPPKSGWPPFGMSYLPYAEAVVAVVMGMMATGRKTAVTA